MSMTPLPTSALMPPPAVGRQAAETDALWRVLRVLRDRDNQVLADALVDAERIANSLPALVAAAVIDYLTKNPPAPGKPGANATDAQIADAVAAYLTKNPPAQGKPGPYAASEIGTVSFGQANLAVVAGVRTLRVTAAGVKAGDRLIFVPTVLPLGYLVGSVQAPEDGKLDVTLTGPALTVASAYSITGRLLRITTA